MNSIKRSFRNSEHDHSTAFSSCGAGRISDTAAEGLPAPGVDNASVAEYLREKCSGTPGRDVTLQMEQQRVKQPVRCWAPLLKTSRSCLRLPMLEHSRRIASLEARRSGCHDRPRVSVERFAVACAAGARCRSRGSSLHTAVRLRLDDLTAAIDERTRLVTISQVSYKTGAWFPHTAELPRPRTLPVRCYVSMRHRRWADVP